MTEERFNISFAAECLEGRDPAEVRAGVAKLFKTDAATLDRLFSGKAQLIKRGCDKATAVKYQSSMAAVGARAIVTRVTADHGSGAAPVTAGTPVTSEPRAEPRAVESMALSPRGSDVLKPEERTRPQAVQVDISHLSVAQQGQSLSDASAPIPPAASAPDYDVSEVGARLAPEPDGPPPVAPDTSALGLSPAGADLGDSDLSAAAPHTVSTEHLGLAEAGSELLDESERKRRQVSAPDTSHLELEQSGGEANQHSR